MKILFYLLPYSSPSEANQAIEIIAIAQGLRKAGITYYANMNYWFDPIENEFLFHKAPDSFNADVHVYFDVYYFMKNMDRLKEIDHSKVNVMIARNDELVPYWQTKPFETIWHFDLILIDHYNLYQHYPPGCNIKPWQIGFDQRVIDYNERYKSNQPKDVILDTFRLHHNLRLLAISKFSKGLADVYPTVRIITDGIDARQVNLSQIDNAYWAMSGRRHNPNYFDQLNSSLLTYVYGGFYHLKPSSFGLKDKVWRRVVKLMDLLSSKLGNDRGKYYFVYQWDSFRLWEALLSNSCPLFLDFEDWGFQLPVNPVNGVHYIGVKGFDFNATIRQMRAMDREEILHIGQTGKQWAMENYGPEAVAHRLIEDIRGDKKYGNIKQTN